MRIVTWNIEKGKRWQSRLSHESISSADRRPERSR
jgi:hypothetical protein